MSKTKTQYLTKEQEAKLIQAAIDGFRLHCHIGKFAPTDLQKGHLIACANLLLENAPGLGLEMRRQIETMQEALKKGKAFLRALKALHVVALNPLGSNNDFAKEVIDSTTSFIARTEYQIKHPIFEPIFRRGPHGDAAFNFWIALMENFYERVTQKPIGRGEGAFARWLSHLINAGELPRTDDDIVGRIKRLPETILGA
jgi:hypothetical protein